MLDEATYGRLTFFSRNPCFSMRPSVISILSWIWGRSVHTISIMECCAERVRPSLAPRPILHFLFFSLHSYNTFSCFSTSVYYTGHKPNDKISGSEARGRLWGNFCDPPGTQTPLIITVQQVIMYQLYMLTMVCILEERRSSSESESLSESKISITSPGENITWRRRRICRR